MHTEDQLTCSWTPRYKFLLVQVCLWWTVDQSPSKTQRNRVQSDTLTLISFQPWSAADMVDLTEHVQSVEYGFFHQHTGYVCSKREIPRTVVSFFFTPGQSARAVFLRVSHGAAATLTPSRSVIQSRRAFTVRLAGETKPNDSELSKLFITMSLWTRQRRLTSYRAKASHTFFKYLHPVFV